MSSDRQPLDSEFTDGSGEVVRLEETPTRIIAYAGEAAPDPVAGTPMIVPADDEVAP